jgi:DNA modification methylase
MTTQSIKTEKGSADSLHRFVGRLGSTSELYFGDCADVIGRLGTVDAVITDPPYGIGNWSSGGGNSITQAQADEMNVWDKSAPPEKVLREAISLGRVAVVWGGNYLMDVLGKCRAPMVWDKGLRGMHFADGEMAWTNFDWGTLRILNFPLASGDTKGRKVHPTQKPTRVMAWSLEQAKIEKGMTVLDPFMGSGTTGVVCAMLGVNFIGIERDADYYKLACDRIAHELDGALL